MQGASDNLFKARYEFSSFFRKNSLYLSDDSIREIEPIIMKAYFLRLLAKEVQEIPDYSADDITVLNKDLESVGLQSVRIDPEMTKAPMDFLLSLSLEINRQGKN